MAVSQLFHIRDHFEVQEISDRNYTQEIHDSEVKIGDGVQASQLYRRDVENKCGQRFILKTTNELTVPIDFDIYVPAVILTAQAAIIPVEHIALSIFSEGLYNNLVVL